MIQLKRKRLVTWWGIVLAIGLLLIGCANTHEENSIANNEAPKEVKVAVVGDAEETIWQFVAEKAKKENIDLEVVKMNDYVQPNIALSDGSVDINAFQHANYLKEWNEEHGTDLQSLGVTFITPLYVFSEKVDRLEDIPENGKALVPVEPAIQGRALLAYEKKGLIKLTPGKGTQASLDDIIENPKHIEFIAVDSAQAPALLKDVDVADIGGGFATDAGLDVDDAIFSDVEYIDEIPRDRFNLIAARPEDKDDPTLKRIVELYQSEDVAEKMDEVGHGQYIPVWDVQSDESVSAKEE